MGYLEYFSNAVAKVPTEIEHEKGQLLASNLEFALIPRFLSPNKGVKDDKAKVEKYTDFYFGTYGGSSFSLGHYCEAYIDWGRWGMALQLFIYGMIGGGLYMLAILAHIGLQSTFGIGHPLGLHEALGHLSSRHGHFDRHHVSGVQYATCSYFSPSTDGSTDGFKPRHPNDQPAQHRAFK